MQPLGRKPTRFPSKQDHHFINERNWWEPINDENKASWRANEKREIEKELEESNEIPD